MSADITLVTARRNKVIAILCAEEGVKENPPNSNRVKYNDWFYLTEKQIAQGLHAEGADKSWCGVLMSWGFFQAAIPLPVLDYMKGFASCYYALNHLDKWGVEISYTNALPGDIVMWNWDNTKDKVFDHVGLILDKTPNNTLSTIEGNTSLGNDSNGGEVMKRFKRPGVSIGKIDVKIIRPNVYYK